MAVILIMVVALQGLAQSGVGIGTNNPQAKLHVAGTLRVDSIKAATNPTRFAVLDPTGTLQYFPVDSIKGWVGEEGYEGFYLEQDSDVTTNAGNWVTRISFTLQPGAYAVNLYCEVTGGGGPGTGNVLLQLTNGISVIGSGNPYCRFAGYGSWSFMKRVVIATTTTYSLMWYSANAGATSTMRNLRISAVKQ